MWLLQGGQHEREELRVRRGYEVYCLIDVFATQTDLQLALFCLKIVMVVLKFLAQ